VQQRRKRKEEEEEEKSSPLPLFPSSPLLKRNPNNYAD
jgi:hypothetical protein